MPYNKYSHFLGLCISGVKHENEILAPDPDWIDVRPLGHGAYPPG